LIQHSTLGVPTYQDFFGVASSHHQRAMGESARGRVARDEGEDHGAVARPWPPKSWRRRGFSHCDMKPYTAGSTAVGVRGDLVRENMGGVVEGGGAGED
jgi:hypothetical protein